MIIHMMVCLLWKLFLFHSYGEQQNVLPHPNIYYSSICNTWILIVVVVMDHQPTSGQHSVVQSQMNSISVFSSENNTFFAALVIAGLHTYIILDFSSHLTVHRWSVPNNGLQNTAILLLRPCSKDFIFE